MCYVCGERIEDPEALFCPHCGRSLLEQIDDRQAYLLVRIPFQSPYRIALDEDRFTIGRKADNDIFLPAGYVSSHHGLLERRVESWHYTDLDSTNGSFVNGERVMEADLQDGDILRIGDSQGNSVSLTFRVLEPEIPEEATVPTPTPSAVAMGVTSLGIQRALLIGRDPQVAIHIPAPTVSWHHAYLEPVPKGHVLSDLNSTNGTFVNGKRIQRPYFLQEGDVVQIGPHRLVYAAGELQQYTVAGGMRLDGMEIVREVGRRANRKRILHGIDISVYPREFIAIVGPSGSGKTTLLKALNGFIHAQGQVLVNGDDLYRQFDLYRTMLGYVPQDEIIHRGLTVSSTLRYAAQLRLPPDMSKAEIDHRVEEVLRQVGMLEEWDSPISQLSGGQRRRVNIGVELLAEPRLFFLDEPTSGLDPGLEKKMMGTLRHLADGGRTILLVTHATANITQCDHVCFLAQGRMVYYGPPEGALEFFGVESGDFADIYDRIDDVDADKARAKAAAWEEQYRLSDHYQRYVGDRLQALPETSEMEEEQEMAHQRPKVHVLRQFSVLTRRYLNLVSRDGLLLTILLAVMPAIALLLMLIARPNWLVGDPLIAIERQLSAAMEAGERSASYTVVGASQLLLFMLALAAVLLGLFSAAYEIAKERSVFLRERMINVRLLTYLGSKTAVLGVFALLQCALLLFILSWKIDLPTTGVITAAPIELYVSLVLGAFAAITLGLFISALVPNTNSVIYIVLLLLFFQILFAGVFFELPGATRSLSYLTLSRWVMEGMGASTHLDGLNGLTRTRFRPEPVTQEVWLPVPVRDPDVEPVTIVTVTREIEILVEPDVVYTATVEVPEVIENEPVTVTRYVGQVFSFTPDPVDISPRQDFQLNYERTPAHLWRSWATLAGFSLLFGLGTMVVLELRDVW
jgi:ABC-type multidrug transport system ATPase subunit